MEKLHHLSTTGGNAVTGAVPAAGIGMLAETIVVFTIAPLTLIAGSGFLLIATRVSARSA